MKQFFSFAVALLFTASSFAQVPPLDELPCRAHSTVGQALANQSVWVYRSDSENNGAAFHTDPRNIITNALGLFNVRIGALSTRSSPGANKQLNAIKTYNLKVEPDSAMAVSLQL